MRHPLIALVLLVAACGGERRDPVSGPLAAEPAPAPTPPLAPTAPTAAAAGPQGAPMPTASEIRQALPSPFDVRVTRALAPPVADDVVLAFAHVAMAKSPTTNYRYELHRDGRLFYVQHSGKPGDWQQPFDRALPATAARTVPAAEVAALLDELERVGFFDHPGYEANPQVEDGSFWLVQARRAGDLHTVVFQNTRPDYVGRLAAIADPLWTQAP